MGETREDLDFPPGAALGVELGVEGGFVENLESVWGCCCVLFDEEDGAHCTSSQDFECFQVLQV